MSLLDLRYGGKSLCLHRPAVMGILNVTTDSFTDGGHYRSLDKAFLHARNMLASGADIIDVGGESTRPGAQDVPVDEELQRVVPVVEHITRELGALVSLDTSKAEVMRAGLRAGAFMVNDVRALAEPGTLELVAETGCPVCLMHMQGEPRTMQQNPHYSDVVAEVAAFLEQRYSAAVAAGVRPGNIVLDPGFGFGKSFEHNLCLLKRLDAVSPSGAPILAGLSRKRMFSQILGAEDADRTVASVAAALLAVGKGAAIVRVHDVAPTVDALKVHNALHQA